MSAPDAIRRRLLRGLAAAPLAAFAPRAEARDYASAAEVFAEIDRLEVDLDARLGALAAAVPAAAPMVRSFRADHDRHRRARAGLRGRLGAGSPPAVSASPGGPHTLADLRDLAQELVHAYAEGLPALRDARAVDVLARHMVDGARHLAVLQMWAEAEGLDG
ncbi:MAG TPA: hypothetical protein VMR21_06280 [Vicinamibacteria bacterium]|nr:hypothetical protein [Vicinamibacteria bacterium]